MSALHLNLKAEYFDAISSGQKTFEYRLATAYWAKRLESKVFTEIILKRGYPNSSDAGRVIRRPWRGFTMETVRHPHFGVDPVLVYAIRVN